MIKCKHLRCYIGITEAFNFLQNNCRSLDEVYVMNFRKPLHWCTERVIANITISILTNKTPSQEI